jgi:diacylglycerol kinase
MALFSFLKSRWESIKIAWGGFRRVISTEKNTWVHATLTGIVILLGIWLSISRLEWAILTLVIGLVWIAEFFNTALEVLVNLVSPGQNQLAKTCKDISAAAVLIAAALSIIIGFLILGPPLWHTVREFLSIFIRR